MNKNERCISSDRRVSKRVSAATLLIFASALLFVGCNKAADGAKAAQMKTEAPAASAEGAKQKEAAKPTGLRGLKNPKNDATIIGLYETLAKCKRVGVFIEGDCPAEDAWIDGVRNDDNAYKTLLNMLEDEDKVVRHAATTELEHILFMHDAGRDKAVGERVLAAAKNENDKDVVAPMGRLAGTLRAKETGLAAAQQELYNTHPNKNFRIQLLQKMQSLNSEAHFDFTEKIARTEKDPMLRKAALRSFWTGSGSRRKDTCRIWKDALGKKETGDIIVSFIPGFKDCKDVTPDVLAYVEKDFKANPKELKMDSSLALEQIYKAKNSDKKAQDKAFSLAKKIVESSDASWHARSSALHFLVRDTKLGKKYAKKFLKDKMLKNDAERLMEE